MAKPLRTDRLKELFLREISTALRTVHGLNTHGIVTLTGVELVDEGKMLHVFFSVFGSGSDRDWTQALLTRSIHVLRAALKSRLRLRTIPAIMFKYDPTPEEAAKIEGIFDRIRAEKKDENAGS
jgi:ribosome-binding factor A